MFPPIQCSKSSYFTQWLISEYLNRINNDKDLPQQQQQGHGAPPPPPNSLQQHHNQSTSSFSAKNLRHLFHASGGATSREKVRSNNNEYAPPKNHLTLEQPCPKNIEFIQLLALNALEFTAPIYSFSRSKPATTTAENNQVGEGSTVAAPDPPPSPPTDKGSRQQECKCPSTRTFVQLSGHPGSFAPAGPNTVWKKMPEDHGDGVCGRQQVGSGIGMDGSLRELLQQINNLDLRGESNNTGVKEEQQASLDELGKQGNNLTTTTTPITVFFNSTSSSSSSSSSPLLSPQIYNIPTRLLPNETQVYRRVNSSTDPLLQIIPKYVTETCYNSQMFLELEDLLTNFSHPNPTIMDVKLGTRTFLESEVKNSKPRPDLYQKLIQVDPGACTPQEHESKAVTKLTYMLFREKQSSSTSLGFRVEGVKVGGGPNGCYPPDLQLHVNFKVLKDERTISKIFSQFCKHDQGLIRQFLHRLHFIRDTLEASEFFSTHEVIGSSLLFIHDDNRVGVWLIDFAKTFMVPNGGKLSHREPWVMGNREDGVLTGVDNIIRIFETIR